MWPLKAVEYYHSSDLDRCPHPLPSPCTLLFNRFPSLSSCNDSLSGDVPSWSTRQVSSPTMWAIISKLPSLASETPCSTLPSSSSHPPQMQGSPGQRVACVAATCSTITVVLFSPLQLLKPESVFQISYIATLPYPSASLSSISKPNFTTSVLFQVPSMVVTVINSEAGPLPG